MDIYDEFQIEEIACRRGFRFPQSVENKRRLLSTLVIRLDCLLSEAEDARDNVKEPKPCKPAKGCGCDCPFEFEPEDDDC